MGIEAFGCEIVEKYKLKPDSEADSGEGRN